jgi:urea transport system substrate-binding protein
MIARIGGISRRQFNIGLGSLAVCAPAVIRAEALESSDVPVASIFDLTGNLEIYGVNCMRASRYAVDQINATGGVLGRKLALKEYDAQSKIELYSRYAQEIGADPKVPVVVGTFTGASREAARPILSRNSKLLFFPTIDEGGECDRYTFMQGTDCIQQQSPLISWSAKNIGKTFYVLAADYVYGHVATAWTKVFAEKEGGSVVGVEFIPLDVSDFASSIRKIQTAKPAVIVAHLVGNDHLSFYRQFAAAGLNKEIQIVSPVFGLGGDEKILSPSEGEGIVVAFSYFDEVKTDANAAFLGGFRKMFPEIGRVPDTPAQVWNAWHQWKVAVEDAQSFDIDKVVLSLEKGVAFEGPAGRVVVDGPSHRNIQDVHLAKVTANQNFEILESYSQVAPSREVVGAGSCDLTGKDKNAHRMINPKF